MSTETLDLPNYSLSNTTTTVVNNAPTGEPISNPESEGQPEGDPNTSESTTEEATLGTTLYGLLTESKILDLGDDYEFGGELSDIETAFQKQQEIYRQRVEEQFFSSIPTELQDVYKGVLEGVEVDKLLDLKRQQVSEYDISTLDSQRSIVSKDLKEKGINDSVINTIIESLEKEGTLETEASTIVERTKQAAQVQIENLRKEKVEAERLRQEEEQKAIVAFSQNVDKTLQNTNWSDDKKKEVFSHIFQASNGNTPLGEKIETIYSNPEHLIQLVDFLTYYDKSKGFDLTKFRKVETQETKNIKSAWEEKLLSTGQIGNRTTNERNIKDDVVNYSLSPI